MKNNKNKISASQSPQRREGGDSVVFRRHRSFNRTALRAVPPRRDEHVGCRFNRRYRHQHCKSRADIDFFLKN